MPKIVANISFNMETDDLISQLSENLESEDLLQFILDLDSFQSDNEFTKINGQHKNKA